MAKFKVGDRVCRTISQFGLEAGKTYTVEKVAPYGWMAIVGANNSGDGVPFHEDYFELVTTNKTTMSSIKSFIKSVTRTEPEKSFVKAGFIDENENLTEKGREALEFVLWEANKDAVKLIADQLIANVDTK